MTLYEVTRQLVARGCPEHPSLHIAHSEWFVETCTPDGSEIVEEHLARDLWTMHAMRWMERVHMHIHVRICPDGVQLFSTGDTLCARQPDLLSAIEAATRGMAPQ